MDRIGVSSSNISSIGYNSINSILEIEFTSGDVYQYQHVPSDIYNDFLLAESHGKYFAINIKDKFQYLKVY